MFISLVRESLYPYTFLFGVVLIKTVIYNHANWIWKKGFILRVIVWFVFIALISFLAGCVKSNYLEPTQGPTASVRVISVSDRTGRQDVYVSKSENCDDMKRVALLTTFDTRTENESRNGMIVAGTEGLDPDRFFEFQVPAGKPIHIELAKSLYPSACWIGIIFDPIAGNNYELVFKSCHKEIAEFGFSTIVPTDNEKGYIRENVKTRKPEKICRR